MRRFLLCVVFVFFVLCLGSLNVVASGDHEGDDGLILYHSFDGGKTFVTKGRVRMERKKLVFHASEREGWEEEALRNLSERGGFYVVAVRQTPPLGGQQVETGLLKTSIPVCALARGTPSLEIAFNQAQDVTSISLIPVEGPKCAGSMSQMPTLDTQKVLDKLRVRVSGASSGGQPIPKARKVEEEETDGSGGIWGFVKRYWYFIVPGVLILFVNLATAAAPGDEKSE